jgi:hypothetical protein
LLLVAMQLKPGLRGCVSDDANQKYPTHSVDHEQPPRFSEQMICALWKNLIPIGKVSKRILQVRCNPGTPYAAKEPHGNSLAEMSRSWHSCHSIMRANLVQIVPRGLPRMNRPILLETIIVCAALLGAQLIAYFLLTNLF